MIQFICIILVKAIVHQMTQHINKLAFALKSHS